MSGLEFACWRHNHAHAICPQIVLKHWCSCVTLSTTVQAPLQFVAFFLGIRYAFIVAPALLG